jgi:hypothetical protein
MRTGILGVTLVKRLQGCVKFIYNSPILILYKRHGLTYKALTPCSALPLAPWRANILQRNLKRSKDIILPLAIP